ncbi:MAG: hypothetical protein C0465_17740 [Ralstonia sp.]|uniref:FG-GAP-like repeat-containing protein n=1 Tax=Ralstonia sp. TaxID=54061 RepID=UPI0025803174|nr:FG-GAP-like repeat-containing protein [Ralstonia sp.]MBA4232443.1 hypothetical protein [Ralstonia sp.]
MHASLILCRVVLISALFWSGAALSQTTAAKRAVGAIAGAFDVSLSGSATYALPLRIAPGTAGTEPKLALVYDSQSPAGSLGPGWSVSGYSIITRGPKNRRTDGAIDGVRLLETDALYLDGQRLLPISTSGSGATRVVEYRKEYDDQTRVRQSGATIGDSIFVAESKGGTKITFGSTTDSKVRFADNTVLLIAANRVEDTVGNYIDFEYVSKSNGDYDLKEVRYTGHTSGEAPFAAVTFNYVDALITAEAYISGRRSSRSTRLHSITSRISSNRGGLGTSDFIVTEYLLGYNEQANSAPSANRFTLTSVRQFGEGGINSNVELSPTTFSYSRPDAGWQSGSYELPVGVPAFASGMKLGKAYRFGDFRGSGQPDLLFSAQINGRHERGAWRIDGGSWTSRDMSGLLPPEPFVGPDGRDLGVVVIDLDGDGKFDLLRSERIGDGTLVQKAWQSTRAASGLQEWVEAPDYAKVKFALSDNGGPGDQFRVGSWTDATKWLGTKRPEIIWSTASEVGFYRSTGNGWEEPAKDPKFKLPPRLDANTRVLDVACSGSPQLIYEIQDQDTKKWSWEIYALDATTGWQKHPEEMTFARPKALEDVPPEGLILIPLGSSASGCVHLSASSTKSNIAETWISAKTTGWTKSLTVPPFSLVDADGKSTPASIVGSPGTGTPVITAHHRHTQGVTKWAYSLVGGQWQPAPGFEAPFPLSSATHEEPTFVYIADFNGDRRMDVAAPISGPNGFGTFLWGEAAGFREQKSLAPPIDLARQDSLDRGVRFVDIDGDGLPDLIYSRANSDGTVKICMEGAAGTTDNHTSCAFRNTGIGWEKKVAWALPVPIAGEKITGNTIQFVDIDSDGYVDALYSYRDSTGAVKSAFYKNVRDGSERALREDAGHPIVALLARFPFTQQDVGDRGVRFLDVNGDGRADMLVGYDPAPTNPASVVTEDCSSGVCKPVWNNLQADAYLNEGTSFKQAPGYAPPLPLAGHPGGGKYATDLSIQLADADGDRLPDLVAHLMHPSLADWSSTNRIRLVFKNTGSGWVQSAELTTALEASAANGMPSFDQSLRDRRMYIQWADVNGDGYTDMVVAKRGQSQVWLGTGAGWDKAAGNRWIIPDDALPDREGDPGFRLVDVNGDGYVDLVFSRCEKSPCGEIADARGFYANNGSAWVDQKAPEKAPSKPFVDSAGRDLGARLIDVTGDGLVDVVVSYAPTDGGAAVQRSVLKNTSRRADVLVEIDTGTSDGVGLITRISYQTMLESRTDEAASSMLRWKRAYEPPADNRAYPIISPVPASYLVGRVVVDEGNQRQLAFSYRYGGYRMDLVGMRSLGFEFREALNEKSRVLTLTETKQDAEWRPLNALERTCLLTFDKAPVGAQSYCPEGGDHRHDGWRKVLTESRTWHELRSSETAGATGLPKVRLRQAAICQTVTSAYELDGGLVSRESTRLRYRSSPAPSSEADGDCSKGTLPVDQSLNVLWTETRRVDGTSVATSNIYGADDTAKWFFGRLTSSTVTKIGDLKEGSTSDQHQESRQAAFTYDSSTGLLASETANVHSSQKSVTTAYDRDKYGNIIATTVSAKLEPHRTSKTTYDALGRFAVREVNPLGHELRKVPRLATGQPESVTGPNGLTSRFAYDEFARTVREEAPSGVVTRTEMHTPSSLCVQSPTKDALPYEAFLCEVDGQKSEVTAIDRAAIAVRVKVGDLPSRVTVLDNKGRTLRTAYDGFDAKGAPRPIYQDTDYDDLGRPKRKYLPYQAGSNTRRLFATADYDDIGRLVTALGADGATSTSSYRSRGPDGGTIVTTTDPMKRSNLTESNTRRLPVKITDPMGGTLSYRYDAGDRLLAMIGPTGSVARHTYDEVGNRIASNDPDIGAWRYDYDAFGRLVQQRDAKNQLATVEYDILGRMTKRVQVDAIATWTYDTAKYGLGKLAAVEGSDGYREDYYYDQLGRQYRWGVRVGAEEFVTTSGFDNLGRVNEIHYPGGFTAVNVYDRKGFLREVTDRKGKARFWTLSETDPFGHVSSELFGNGIRTNQTFEDETGRIRSITARHADGTRVLDLDLKYDLVGSLERRHEKVVGNEEWFKYDNLDRLTQWRRNNGDVFDYQFDAAGRIIKKSGIGSYEYPKLDASGTSPLGPHHAVAKTRIGKQLAQYTYDENANLTSGPTGSFEYTSDNRLKLLVANQFNWARFDYAPSGDRYRQSDRTSGMLVETLYLGAYERVTEHTGRPAMGKLGKLVRHRYYLLNASGVFATYEANTEYVDVPAGLDEDATAPPLKLGSLSTAKVWYLHKDQLGSVIRITDEGRELHKRFWYDPWGHRFQRDKETATSKLGDKLQSSWQRGFTGHEHMDRFGFIHMNGRAGNPGTGQFTSADIINQDLSDTQAINAFSYARNNPLKYVDPTGHIFGAIGRAFQAVGNAISDIGNGIERAFQQAGKWLEENWRTVVIVAAVVIVTVATGGAGAGLAGAILSGMAGGAVGGALGAALYGGSIEDVLRGAIIGAIAGGITGGLSYGATYAGLQGVAGAVGRGVASGAGSGTSRFLSGGSFADGFNSGFVSGSVSALARVNTSSLALRASVAALAGGVTSELTGGKFVNGAATAAFAAVAADLAARSLASEGRSLTKGEQELLKKSGVSVDSSRVKIVGGRFSGLQDPKRPMAPNGNVYMGDNFEGEYVAGGKHTADFIHEMKHVSQFQDGVNVSLRGALLHTRAWVAEKLSLGRIDVYDYKAGSNIESDAMKIEDDYRRSHGMTPTYP